MPARVRELSVLRLALWPTQHLIQLVMGALLLWVMRQGSEADCLPLSGAEVAHIYAFMVCIGTVVPVF